jgi:hypothetical protein
LWTPLTHAPRLFTCVLSSKPAHSFFHSWWKMLQSNKALYIVCCLKWVLECVRFELRTMLIVLRSMPISKSAGLWSYSKRISRYTHLT